MRKIPVISKILIEVTMKRIISWDMISGECTVSIFRVEACLHNLFFASEDADSAFFCNVSKRLSNYIPEGSTVLRNISALPGSNSGHLICS
jgi:hypothetical protein